MLGDQYDLKSTEKGLKRNWPATLPLDWSQPIGDGYGNGVVQHGRFFVADRLQGQERLLCFHAETGELLWKFAQTVPYSDAFGYNNGPRASPVANHDRAFLYGVTGKLTCLQAEDGRVLWQRDMNTEYNVQANFFGVGASPLVYGNKLLVMVGGTTEEVSPDPNRIGSSPIPNGSAMVALDRLTGEEVYRVGAYLASYSAPVIARLENQDWCLALVREGLMVFDPATGKLADFYPFRSPRFESVNAASPILLGEEILVSETYDIGSARLQFLGGKLKEIWKDKPMQKMQLLRAHWATPIAIGPHLYAGSGRNSPDADLRSLEWAKNEVNWVKRNRDRTTLILVDDLLIALGEFGKLQLIQPDPKELRELANYDLTVVAKSEKGLELVQAPTWAPPIYSHGRHLSSCTPLCALSQVGRDLIARRGTGLRNWDLVVELPHIAHRTAHAAPFALIRQRGALKERSPRTGSTMGCFAGPRDFDRGRR